MAFRVTRNEWPAEIARFREFLEDLPKIGAEEAVGFIWEQTAAGKDVNRQVMRPYTFGYKKDKTRKYGKATPVNLRATEDMLKSLADATPFGVVDVPARLKKKAQGNNNRRKFLSPSPAMGEHVLNRFHIAARKRGIAR
jgi:hypothetical protein